MSFVQPRVFRTGYTQVDMDQIKAYLEYTKQQAFMEDIQDAMQEGISGAECLCSMYAKLCYKSLVVGKNANIKSVRSIKNNLVATFDSRHGSVFEHVGFNFICTDVSRVFSHELVRHRAGTAFSQTSGRYCRPVDKDGVPQIDFVHDPILDPVKDTIEQCLVAISAAYRDMELRLGLADQHAVDSMRVRLRATMGKYDDKKMSGLPMTVAEKEVWASAAETDAALAEYKESNRSFDWKKKVTSAMRRILPNGQSNEIGFSCNIRTLRHCVQIRTQRFAEWEIRNVFAQIYGLVKEKFPMVFYGAKERMVDGLPEIHGMGMQPYDVTVEGLPPIELLEEVNRRGFKFKSQTDQLRWSELISRQLTELTPTA